MKPATQLQFRLGVASRAAAAIFGGYALAASASSLLAVVLPLHKSDAVLTATLLSFVLYTCAALWAFAARSALRGWFGIGLLTAIFLLGILAHRGLA
ncbi:DUF3649 domain-containing protein [Allopusillimonas ginsengisoli]|uniref:DUF3649 domain-containing protein n=1 Tax=Allopusillimonas ginsengisoli TaxID=453575 RepID=UPI0010C20199|nr:iron transporter [Alcaligenaceae bacterium]TKR54646.1 iron transporter [Allopusillimonas ginsengisoli]